MDENIQFPMTGKNVNLHLRNTKCPLHNFAEYYQKALMTFYATEVKLYGPELCCMPEKSFEIQQKDSKSDPPYEKDSPHVMPTRSPKNNCDGDNKSIASLLPVESNVISEVVKPNWNDTSWNEFVKRPQNTSSNIDSYDPIIIENNILQHSPHVMPTRSLKKNCIGDINSIASPFPVVPNVICDVVKPNWNDTSRNEFVKRPQNTSSNVEIDEYNINENNKDFQIAHLSKSLITLQRQYSTKCQEGRVQGDDDNRKSTFCSSTSWRLPISYLSLTIVHSIQMLFT